MEKETTLKAKDPQKPAQKAGTSVIEPKIPLSEAADAIGVRVDWLRDAIDCEELTAYNRSHGKERPRWYVTMSDARAYLESKKKAV